MTERVRSQKRVRSRRDDATRPLDVPQVCRDGKLVMAAYDAHMRAMGIGANAREEWLAAARKKLGTDDEIPMMSALRAIIAVAHGFPHGLVREGFPEGRGRA